MGTSSSFTPLPSPRDLFHPSPLTPLGFIVPPVASYIIIIIIKTYEIVSKPNKKYTIRCSRTVSFRRTSENNGRRRPNFPADRVRGGARSCRRETDRTTETKGAKRGTTDAADSNEQTSYGAREGGGGGGGERKPVGLAWKSRSFIITKWQNVRVCVCVRVLYCLFFYVRFD